MWTEAVIILLEDEKSVRRALPIIPFARRPSDRGWEVLHAFLNEGIVRNSNIVHLGHLSWSFFSHTTNVCFKPDDKWMSWFRRCDSDEATKLVLANMSQKPMYRWAIILPLGIRSKLLAPFSWMAKGRKFQRIKGEKRYYVHSELNGGCFQSLVGFRENDSRNYFSLCPLREGNM